MAGLHETLNSHGISEEELLRRSTRLERWLPEDRALSLARARLRKSGERGYAVAALPKPRTGRGIGRKHLRAALAGSRIPRIPRAKLERALADALRHRGVTDTRAERSAGALSPSNGGSAETRP
ncbi:MAG: hypothetical protein FJ148_26470 [Deltaproteobacteria bacterium]|nr:hypothetical protein [Deltaproteobacteria bacterium]